MNDMNEVVDPKLSVPMDMEAMWKICPDDEIIKAVVEAFLQAVPETMESLSAVVAEGDVEQVRFFAHRLKGSARSIAAIPLGGAAEVLEHTAIQGSSDSFGDLFKEVQRLYEELLTFLKSSKYA